MGEKKKRFDFDEFDRLCAEGLEEPDQTPRPGEIGGVDCKPTRIDFGYLQSLGHVAGNPFYQSTEEPPDDAA